MNILSRKDLNVKLTTKISPHRLCIEYKKFDGWVKCRKLVIAYKDKHSSTKYDIVLRRVLFRHCNMNNIKTISSSTLF